MFDIYIYIHQNMVYIYIYYQIISKCPWGQYTLIRFIKYIVYILYRWCLSIFHLPIISRYKPTNSSNHFPQQHSTEPQKLAPFVNMMQVPKKSCVAVKSNGTIWRQGELKTSSLLGTTVEYGDTAHIPAKCLITGIMILSTPRMHPSFF